MEEKIQANKISIKMVEIKIYLKRKDANELINLKQELGFINENLPDNDRDKLITAMCKIPLGTLY